MRLANDTVATPGPVFLSKGTHDGHSIDELLDLAGLRYRSSSDLSEFPKDHLDAVISQCWAVVAYVGSARPATGVVLEIGAGLGRGLPVVVILGPKVRASSLSPALRELPSMRLPAKVSQAAADRLRALLVTTAKTPSGVLTTSQLGATSREHWVDEHERGAATVLQRLGAVIVGYEPANRRGQARLGCLDPRPAWSAVQPPCSSRSLGACHKSRRRSSSSAATWVAPTR